jgi:transcriptional regulator with XRE-family HTH domain
MGRNQTRIPSSYWREAPAWYRNYYNEWSTVVGDRVKRMRAARDMILQDVADKIAKPNGGTYSVSFFSRLERGASSPPLYAYLGLAELFEVHPGRLLGADDAERDASPEEMVVVRFLRWKGISPDAALHVLSASPLPGQGPEPLGPAERLDDTPPPVSPNPYVKPPRAEFVKPRYELMDRDFDVGPLARERRVARSRGRLDGP